MGEVFRARDTALNRVVAIKVLPAAMAAEPERLVRFKREAQFLASLNHPNVAAIFGEDVIDRWRRARAAFLADVAHGVDGKALDRLLELVSRMARLD